MGESDGTAPLPGLEEALRESEERFRRAFEFAGIGMAILGVDGRWIRVNRALCDMLGYTPDELSKTTFQALTHPDDRQASSDGSEAVLSGRIAVLQLEKRYRHKDGHYVWSRLTTSVVRSPSGEPVHYISQIEDIDARKRAESARKTSDERLRTLVEYAPDGIFILEAGRIVYTNPAGATMFGAATAGELIGRPALDLTHADFRDIVARHLGRVTRGHANPPGVMTGVQLDGTTFEAESQSLPFPSEGGQGALVFLRDISERRRLEEHLRQMQKMEGLGLLAGGIAHDFNNILAVMTLQLGMLLGGSAIDERTREALRELEDQAQRASGLVRQLLMFSRRSVIDVRSLDLNHAVEHVLIMLRRLIGETVEIAFIACPGPLPIEADAGMLEQVVVNLAVNARDAMARGGRIVIETGVTEVDARYAAENPRRRPGRFTTLSVTDTGSGMDAATLQRIFEPFFTTKAPGKGTGLGLATVYGIVEQHRGWVEVESEVGRGTSVRIFFPSQRSGHAELPTASSPGAATDDDRDAAAPRTILLVEDEEVVRRVLSRCLREAGYDVVEARSGPEAAEIWNATRLGIDLLLTDMLMPGSLNGLELAALALRDKPTLKVIVCSGYSLEMHAQGRPSDPRIGYLAKPFEVETLWAMVRESLRR